MKNQYAIFFILLIPVFLFGQKLDVDGDSYISGKLGIGVLTPASKLQVGDFSGAAGNTYITVGSAGGNTSISGLKLRHFSDDFGFTIESDDNTGAQGLHFRRHANSSIGVSDIFIDISGNIGIGTTSPSERLDINGSISVNGTVSGVSDPINSQDAVNKSYLDGLIESGSYTATWVTINGFTTDPSFTTCEYSRVGDLVNVVCRFGGSGPTFTSGTNTATITLPPGLDVANIAGGQLISGVFASDHYRNGGDAETGIVCHQSSTTVQVKVNGSNSGIAGAWCNFVYKTTP